MVMLRILRTIYLSFQKIINWVNSFEGCRWKWEWVSSPRIGQAIQTKYTVLPFSRSSKVWLVVQVVVVSPSKVTLPPALSPPWLSVIRTDILQASFRHRFGLVDKLGHIGTWRRLYVARNVYKILPYRWRLGVSTTRKLWSIVKTK